MTTRREAESDLGGPPVTRLRRSCLRVLRGAGLTVAVVLQFQIAGITRVDERTFDRYVVELEHSGAWRYGYFVQRHGAVLVKTRLTPGTPALRPRDGNDQLAGAMTRELHSVWPNAVRELLFYAALWGLAHLATRPGGWWQRLGSKPASWVAAGLTSLTAAAWLTVAMAPYLLTGYGEPLFSNRVGPGALSYTSFVPATGTATLPVSYGMLLEAVLLWPMIATTRAAEPLSRLMGVRGSLWFVTCLFWSTGAALLAFGSSNLERRIARS